MPFTTLSGPRDAIMALFQTVWDAQTPPVPALLYDDLPGGPPSDGLAWARIQVRHNTANQVTLGGIGAKRFRRFGIVTVQIFTPSGEGLDEADKFAKVAIDAFEGQSTGGDAVEFRNVRSNEIGQDGPWFQTNVLAEFEYDEVK